MTGWNIWGYSD